MDSNFDLSFFKNFFSTLTNKKAIIIVVSLGIIVYFNSLFNGFVADDIPQIVNNPSIHSFPTSFSLFTQGTFYDQSGQGNNYYKPLLSLFFSIIYSFSGINPVPYHLFQLFIHISNSFLVYLIFKHFFKKQLSLVLALLFLVHPINAEAVVYISALQEPLFLFFGLSALLYTITTSKRTVLSSLFVTLLLLCSLLSKETGIAFIFIIPIYLFFYHKDYMLTYLVPCISVPLIYIFLRLGLAHIPFANIIPVVPIQTLPISSRLISIPTIILFYLKTFIYPLTLLSAQTWFVPSFTFTNVFFPLVIDSIVFLFIVILGISIFKSNRKLFAAFLLFSAWFTIGLSIHLQLVPLDETVADRWFYLPIIGLLGLLGVLAAYFNFHNTLKKWFLPLALSILLLFAVRVIIRNMDWHTETSLYVHDSRLNPTSHQLQEGLGSIALSMGDKSDAERHYIQATNLFPSHVTFGALGNLYMIDNNPQKAISAYQNALQYYGNNAFSWAYLGMAQYKAGYKQQAITSVEKAYSMLPNNSFTVLLETMKSNQPITIQQ